MYKEINRKNESRLNKKLYETTLKFKMTTYFKETTTNLILLITIASLHYSVKIFLNNLFQSMSNTYIFFR